MAKEENYLDAFRDTDPEFYSFFINFAEKEVVEEKDRGLDERTRYMAILAALLGCQGKELFEKILPQALDAGVTPVEAKEIIYQAAAYLGIGRVYPFLEIANAVMEKKDIFLPLPPQGTTTPEDRVEKGEAKQVEIFGEGMRGFSRSGPEESKHINRWLSGNCFGDYYTRNGLDNRQREMITFCYIAAQGGCEPQLLSHAAGNMKVGNDKQFLINVISQCMPYIGYPRTLNAVRIINEAAGNGK
ncbi:MAG TPA: carboxymuconolactone decarboxylase family protein [Candidatus Eisenbergiella merdipullorum]|uniref:Carboxymuconolactone decarboxylase family protein n=1 Tax=Candidatus Eisenbergiella merdipullorum TaxID=2838553 RepID=A0A9D2KZW8_9FIRM|nr:carboxymuconolactone decarboxylase family protein [Candidatus Eisenbergiella merdipullorum]